jgi:serine/threonine protein kinase
MEGKKIRVGGRFLLNMKLGSGSSGVVFNAIDTTTSKQVAAKLEPVKEKAPQLSNEAGALRVLLGCRGVPEIIWYGTEGGYNILVTELLGSSLEALLKQYNRFSLQTVVACGLQMLERLQAIHSRDYLHRDIKPDNILVGNSNPEVFYAVDFGIAKRFRDPVAKQHIPYKESKALTGTARYASVNSHIGIEQSRRDDLESLIYTLVYFFKGTLPWQGIREANRLVRCLMIGEAKRKETPKTICSMMPDEFSEMLEYTKGLRFDEGPNYQMLTAKLTGLASRLSLDILHFDWAVKAPPRVSARAETVKESSRRSVSMRRNTATRRLISDMKLRSNSSKPRKKRHRDSSVETVKHLGKPHFRDRTQLKSVIEAKANSHCSVF